MTDIRLLSPSAAEDEFAHLGAELQLLSSGPIFSRASIAPKLSRNEDPTRVRRSISSSSSRSQPLDLHNENKQLTPPIGHVSPLIPLIVFFT